LQRYKASKNAFTKVNKGAVGEGFAFRVALFPTVLTKGCAKNAA